MWLCDNFNSQPHKEADTIVPGVFRTNDISTHSLTRRLTLWRMLWTGGLKFQLTASQGGWRLLIQVSLWHRHFNSQPHKEADCTTPENIYILCYFNSQPHKEADNEKQINNATIIISTHSLTRRLTSHRWSAPVAGIHFNSQPHKEADRNCTVWMYRQCQFQLTASQGGWRKIHLLPRMLSEFQLTASQGGWPCS